MNVGDFEHNFGEYKGAGCSVNTSAKQKHRLLLQGSDIYQSYRTCNTQREITLLNFIDSARCYSI